MSEEDGLSCPADISLYEDRALCACLSFYCCKALFLVKLMCVQP